MNDRVKYSRHVVCAGLAVFALLSAWPAQAADSSAWGQDTKSAVRLIAGTNTDDAPLRADFDPLVYTEEVSKWTYASDFALGAVCGELIGVCEKRDVQSTADARAAVESRLTLAKGEEVGQEYLAELRAAAIIQNL